MSQLLCPKCHNVMTQYERNNVVVDQCPECGGLFLDRGELERLIRAEAAYYAQPGEPVPAAPAPRPAPREPHGDVRDSRDYYDSGDEHYYDSRVRRPMSKDEYKKYKRKKKAKSFLEDLLDF